MTRRSYARVVLASLSLPLAATACAPSEKKADPAPLPAATTVRERNIEPGIAGGTVDRTSTTAVTVKSVDVATRTVTLADDQGNSATFQVSPQIRNLDQLKPGDRLTATFNERLVVYVRSDRGGGGEAGDVYTKALDVAPKGAKPGALIAEDYQVVATVSALDPATRVATLTFADGSSGTVKVRDDVDLGRYTVGDRVIIRVTSSLSLLTSRP